MTHVIDSRQDFWMRMRAGGYSTIPRWTLEPAPGTGQHQLRIPDDLAAAVRATAAAGGMSVESVLLAAHTVVLQALSGDSEVAGGCVVESGRRPLPFRLAADSPALVPDADRLLADLRAHAPADDDVVEHDLGAGFETVFDPAGGTAELHDAEVLRVGIVQDETCLAVRLRYSTSVIDDDYAARIAGYHLRALQSVVDGTEAGVLSAAELEYQLDGLAGPHRDLPDKRVHELFEDRVRAHPDAVAAVHRDRRWTYRELNGLANRLARALVADGLRGEDVVAVVTERNLDWLAAVLAVFKAGGVYLPIEPHFPADRIGTTLRRAGCRRVLTESGSSTQLDAALATMPEVRRREIVDAYLESADDTDLGIEVRPDQLAYIYFTSGSTGEPKGAMCEHVGMVNHLFAKIDDLRVEAGTVVAQTAPQCFDISLWQLVSALLVGGRTLLVEQDVILDVERFVDTVIDGRVAVLQIVPSYLEVVLSYLDRSPRELPDLRVVSVTGEALKKELAQRWFATVPGIPLVNAYGLTETSDDTNHHVMDRVPAQDRVPLGRPINNVHLYIVDAALQPVPLGAPGEIVFAGVCVGRGYINDPVRTGAAFGRDPHRPDRGRFYRSGDFGRWLPDGTLEFLGRRDTQVKIAGFRIEIGEIENTLLRVPGVSDGAVVVATRADGSRQLVAFYAGPEPLPLDLLRSRLAESLPGYMVPAAFHWRERLPLTANSKIDRKMLTALAGELVVEVVREAPQTPTEERLAAAWAGVLGVPPAQIGRHDHFFDLGGSSLSAVKLAVALERAISLKDVLRHPVLLDLARVLEAVPAGTGKETS